MEKAKCNYSMHTSILLFFAVKGTWLLVHVQCKLTCTISVLNLDYCGLETQPSANAPKPSFYTEKMGFLLIFNCSCHVTMADISLIDILGKGIEK